LSEYAEMIDRAREIAEQSGRDARRTDVIRRAWRSLEPAQQRDRVLRHRRRVFYKLALLYHRIYWESKS
jgi:hypothetical protein